MPSADAQTPERLGHQSHINRQRPRQPRDSCCAARTTPEFGSLSGSPWRVRLVLDRRSPRGQAERLDEMVRDRQTCRRAGACIARRHRSRAAVNRRSGTRRRFALRIERAETQQPRSMQQPRHGSWDTRTGRRRRALHPAATDAPGHGARLRKPPARCAHFPRCCSIREQPIEATGDGVGLAHRQRSHRPTGHQIGSNATSGVTSTGTPRRIASMAAMPKFSEREGIANAVRQPRRVLPCRHLRRRRGRMVTRSATPRRCASRDRNAAWPSGSSPTVTKRAPGTAGRRRITRSSPFIQMMRPQR